MNSAGFGNNSFICSANFQLIGSSELNSQHLIEQPNSLFDTKNDDDFPTLGGIATNETDKTQTKTIQQKSFANIAAKAPAFKKMQSILKTTNAQTSSLNYPPNLSPSLNLLKIDDTTKNSGLFKFNDFTSEDLNKKFHDKAENNSFAPLLAKSRFDDLFERDPYLNHMRNVQEDVLLQIREISSNENFIIPKYQINEQKTEISTPTETPPPPPSNEWTSVVSRRRKASLNTEYSSHRPSPFTDDGYMVSIFINIISNYQFF
ncbi:hypothetical protein Mgra_00000210 [Meloidogyne graminicola]|uniref:Uncharacterized protein n=1 Tax=Meloidogyne graminicola TaxID=189291 RepID=A0A8T0A4C3_9BILA|nr:hypothetical protein Mgra_00000210 [Meloidogyne graminicola]